MLNQDKNTPTSSAVQNMSTLEIAKCTGKQHIHVLRDARKMFKDLKLDDTQYKAEYEYSQNKFLPMYELPQNLALTLVTGYGLPLRHKLLNKLLGENQYEDSVTKTEAKTKTKTKTEAKTEAKTNQAEEIRLTKLEAQVNDMAKQIEEAQVKFSEVLEQRKVTVTTEVTFF